MARSKVTFLVDDGLYARFRACAKSEGRSMTWYLSYLMGQVVAGSKAASVPVRKKKRVAVGRSRSGKP
jgi:hypothetical protein